MLSTPPATPPVQAKGSVESAALRNLPRPVGHSELRGYSRNIIFGEAFPTVEPDSLSFALQRPPCNDPFAVDIRHVRHKRPGCALQSELDVTKPSSSTGYVLVLANVSFQRRCCNAHHAADCRDCCLECTKEGPVYGVQGQGRGRQEKVGSLPMLCNWLLVLSALRQQLPLRILSPAKGAGF